MPVLQVDNPLIENYLAQFDRLNPEEQRIVFSKLGRKRIVVESPTVDDDWQSEPARILPNGKTPVDDFLDYCKELNLPPLTDEEADQVRFDALPKIAERTPEERQAVFDDFMASWKGCLKGVPHMSAKEIRAERLERKYGQHRGEE